MTPQVSTNFPFQRKFLKYLILVLILFGLCLLSGTSKAKENSVCLRASDIVVDSSFNNKVYITDLKTKQKYVLKYDVTFFNMYVLVHWIAPDYLKKEFFVYTEDVKYNIKKYTILKSQWSLTNIILDDYDNNQYNTVKLQPKL